MSSKINLAMQILNKYDYESGKSAQEALQLIYDMEDLFANQTIEFVNGSKITLVPSSENIRSKGWHMNIDPEIEGVDEEDKVSFE